MMPSSKSCPNVRRANILATQPSHGVVKGTIVAYVRVILCAISWAALCVYAWWAFVYCFPTWSREVRGNTTIWTRLRGKASVRYHVGGAHHQDTLDGQTVIALLLQWIPLLLAALCAYLAAALPKGLTAARSPAAMRACWVENTKTLISRVVTWPIPSQRFWLYWCDGLSAGELAVVLAWVALHVVSVQDYVRYYQRSYNARTELGFRMPLPLSIYQTKWCSMGFGWLAFADMGFLFLPVSHNSFLAALTGLPYSALIRYHRWIGQSALITTIMHGVTYCFYWIADPNYNFFEELFRWGAYKKIQRGVGLMAGLSALLLWVTSMNWVRRKYFEVYYKTHMFGFVCFVFFAMVHQPLLWNSIGLALYAADLVQRVVQAQHVSTVQGACIAEDNSFAVVELSAAKEFSKCPLTDMFLMLPSISRWQWHPYSIMGTRDNGDGHTSTLTLAVQNTGDWTQKVFAQLRRSTPLPVRMVGSLDGIDLEDLREHSHIVLLAGGFAATPLLSLLQALIKAKAQNLPVVAGITHVELVWVGRWASMFSALPADVVAAARDSNWLTVKLHCTSGNKVPPKCPEKAAAGFMEPDVCLASAGADGSLQVPWLSAFSWSTARPMQVKTPGPLYTALVSFVAIVGAFMALVNAHVIDIQKLDKAAFFKYTTTGLVLTTGLPMMLVVMPVNLFRYLRNAKQDAFSASHGDKGPPALGTPHLEVVGTSMVRNMEGGSSLPIISGRPDLEAVLTTAALKSAYPEVAVFCAGAPQMNITVELLVHKINRTKAHAEASLDFHKFTFIL